MLEDHPVVGGKRAITRRMQGIRALWGSPEKVIYYSIDNVVGDVGFMYQGEQELVKGVYNTQAIIQKQNKLTHK